MIKELADGARLHVVYDTTPFMSREGESQEMVIFYPYIGVFAVNEHQIRPGVSVIKEGDATVTFMPHISPSYYKGLHLVESWRTVRLLSGFKKMDEETVRLCRVASKRTDSLSGVASISLLAERFGNWREFHEFRDESLNSYPDGITMGAMIGNVLEDPVLGRALDVYELDDLRCDGKIKVSQSVMEALLSKY